MFSAVRSRSAPSIVPFPQRHRRDLGFRIGRFAYSTDTDGLDDNAFAQLQGVEVWIVDALRENPHPSHAHLNLALSWIDRVEPAKAYHPHEPRGRLHRLVCAPAAGRCRHMTGS